MQLCGSHMTGSAEGGPRLLGGPLIGWLPFHCAVDSPYRAVDSTPVCIRTLFLSSWMFERISVGLESLGIGFSTNLKRVPFNFGFFFPNMTSPVDMVFKNVLRPILRAGGCRMGF